MSKHDKNGIRIMSSTLPKYRNRKNRYKDRAGYISPFLRRSVYEQDGRRCRFCHVSLRFRDMTLDHLTPVSRGGKSTIDNLACACSACNHAKANMTEEEFLIALASEKYPPTPKAS